MLLLPLLLLPLISFQTPANDDQDPESGRETRFYRVVEGKVDASTFMGWRVFHMNCHTCHGIDAVGTDIAPNLLERLKTMGPDAFAKKVLMRYRISVSMNEASAETGKIVRDAIIEEMVRQQRGAQGEIIMPGWDEFNPGIRYHILDLYAYLKARSDGVLGAGRPEIIQE
ncbi:MAG: hypothetical protein HY356_06850 [Gammaproteobacteria bacterium]|nr:hypothetical protein [Gammaproteobacteria bacterium]